MAQEIRVKITGDASGLSSAATQASGSLQKFGQSARGAAYQSQQLSMQMTDVAVSLYGGIPPLTVLVQQGGQLRDLYGGIIPMFRALSAAITPMVAGLAGLGAVVGAAGLAWTQATGQADAFQKSINLTGNYVGLTGEQFRELTEQIALTSGRSQSSAAEMAQGFVSSGKVGGEALGVMSQAALAMQKATGETSEKVVADMVSMSSGVAAWAVQHNAQYHFITQAQLEHIQKLEEEGRQQEAMIEVGQRLIQHLGDQRDGLTGLAWLWDRVSSNAGSYMDMIRSWTASDTTAEKIADINKELLNIKAGPAPGLLSGRIAELEAERQALIDGANASREKAAADSSAAELEQRRIKANANADSVMRQSISRLDQYSARVRQLQADLQAGLITQEKFTASVTALAQQANPAQVQKQPEAPKKTFEQINREIIATRGTDLRSIEHSGYQAATDLAEKQAEDFKKQQQTIITSAQSMAQQTKIFNAGMIQDERQRGEALIEIERQTQQEKIDAWQRAGYDVSAAQDALNESILAKQRQLNEQLKPEFQKLMESWSQTTQMMSKTWDSAMTGAANNAANAFGQFISGQKVNIKSLAQSFISTLGSGQFKSLLSSLFGSSTSAGSSWSSLFSTAASWVSTIFSAQGNVFSSASGLHSHANTVVDKPTMFAFAKGAGIMGEAGAEAIMPLGRTGDGNLGVRMIGGAQAGSSVNVSMPLNISIDSSADQAKVQSQVQQAVAIGNKQLLRLLKDKGVLA